MRKGLTTRHSLVFLPITVSIGFVSYLSILAAMLIWPKFVMHLQYVGFIFSTVLTYLFFVNKSKGRVITKQSVTLRKTLVIISLQIFLVVFYFVSLEFAVFYLPNHQTTDNQFLPQTINILFNLQPWSLSSLIGFLLARQFSKQTNSYPKLSNYIKPLLPKQAAQRLAYFIEFFISRVFSLAFTISLSIVCLAIFCCQQLGIIISYGFNLETFFLCSLLLLPISYKFFSKILRFFAGKEYPVSYYYILFSSYFFLMIVIFSLISQLAHNYIPHLIPVLAHAKINLIKREYGLYFFLLGCNISMGFLIGSCLMRLAVGMSARRFIGASFILPSLLMFGLYKINKTLHLSYYLVNHNYGASVFIILMATFIALLYLLSHMKDSRYLGLGFAKSRVSHEFLKPIIYMRSRFLTIGLYISLLILAQYSLFGLLVLLSVIPATLILIVIVLLRFRHLN